MAITYSFVDKVLYGTDDINGIVSSMVGAGVAPFLSAESYNVSDINALTETLVGSGVQLDGCLCSVSGVGTEEMTVAVGQGIIFFEGGVRLIADEDGYVISVTPNTAGYVYGIYRPALQVADIEFGEELPSDGECVLLARLEADGTLRGERQFAKSKIATLGRNVSYTTTFDFGDAVLYEEYEGPGSTVYGKYAVSQVDADLSRFNYALVERFPRDVSGYRYGGIYDIATKQFVIAARDGYDAVWFTQSLYETTYNMYVGVDVVDGKLTLIIYGPQKYIKYYKKISPIYVTLI